MSRNLILDTFRMIKNTKTKFITLIAIVALGLSFFIGITASSTVMSYSVDSFNDEYNLMDFEIFSPYGFNDDDIEDLKQISEDVVVEGRKFIDAYETNGANNQPIRVFGYTNNKTINEFQLVDGRMPESENECLFGYVNQLPNGYRLGDYVNLSSDSNLEETLKNSHYKIVGIVKSPEFINMQLGYSTLNNQILDYYVYVNESNFKNDYYSSLVLKYNDIEKYNSFEKEYVNETKNIKKDLEEFASEHSYKQYQRIKEEVNNKYNDGLKEFEDSKNEAELKLEDAKNELISAQNKIDNALKEINDGNKSISDGYALIDKAYNENITELNNAQGKLDVEKNNFNSKKDDYYNNIKPGLNTQLSTLTSNIDTLLIAKNNIDVLNENISTLEEEKTRLIIRKEELLALSDLTVDEENEIKDIEIRLVAIDDETKILNASVDNIIEQIPQINNYTELEGAINLINSSINEINNVIKDSETKFANAEQSLNDAQKEIEKGYITLDLEVEKNRNELEEKAQEIIDAKDELKNAQKEISDGWIEYNENKLKADNELSEADQELQDAKNDIDDIEYKNWTIIGRDMQFSSQSFYDTVNQMENISMVFPVFFLFVSALVCSTTMTRMITEQRGQIGTFRSLGYSKLACISKYLIYASIASITGSIIGVISGIMIFPAIIYDAWNMMYFLPQIKLNVSVISILIAVLSFYLVMFSVTWISASSELKVVTSQLLRPKAPSMGKRILIEKISLVWNRFSFISKVTARNIFRYKKRFFMTVIGISGCMALLIAGFGIRNSIGGTITKEYSKLNHFDGYLVFNDNLTASEIETSENAILNNPAIDEVFKTSIYNVNVKNMEQMDSPATLTVFDNNEDMHTVRNVINRKTKQILELPKDGVLINEKLGTIFGLKIGDTISINTEDDRKANVVIKGMFESYVHHNVFISSDYYQSVFNETNEINSIFVKTNEQIENQQLRSTYNIKNLSLFTTWIDFFSDMVDGLNVVIYVLIICAALLAFIVLGNLTSVNIEERKREIATLKVLGFNRKEINSYIFKENMILVLFGVLFGGILGRILHIYIILLVEEDNMMFVRDLNFGVYLTAALITFAFAILFNIIVGYILKNIKMVESLKSVE
ncbi:MAG: FtsX-like permease family protein [Anaerorhabdus sp.]